MLTQYDVGWVLVGYAIGLASVLAVVSLAQWLSERARKRRLERGPYWKYWQ